MNLGALPPVGDTVRLSPSKDNRLPFAPWHVRYYASGSAALAAAVRAALCLHRGRNEVILPAYGCPALVAATLWAGGHPVLVDLAPGLPWLDATKLSAAISPRTAAIVAVDLLGIPERLSALRALARPRGILLIEDSAQAFLDEGPGSGRGDLVVLSFGRGKPVSLLGGGALLYGDTAIERHLCLPESNGETLRSRKVRAALYRLLRRPFPYGLVRRLPFLHLGETRFELLSGVEAAPAWLPGLLPAAIAARRRSEHARERLARGVAERSAPAAVDLARACGSSGCGLLRYPLLLPEGLRDRVHRLLDRAGLGSSILYPAALPDIPGVEGQVEVRGGCDEARRFARRLLTLPLHDGVRPGHFERMERIIRGAPGASAGCDEVRAPRATRPG